MAQRGDLYYELLELIGAEALLAFAEAFGGRRLPIPTNVRESHRIAKAIGLDAAELLSSRYAPDVITVPLARPLRVAHYKKQKLSNGKIATRIGVTEKCVEAIVRSLRGRNS